MRALVLVLALLLATPASAHGLGLFHSHKAQVVKVAPAPKPEVVNPVPFRPAAPPKKPDGFWKVAGRSAGISLVVTGVITVVKVGVTVITGIPLL